MKSTRIGLKYPSGRGEGLKTGAGWLKGKREDDGAEGLWRVGNKLYDLEKWARNHPGGGEWITLTQGTDITEAFEAHHVNLTAERLLPKFYVRDAVGPRSSPFTFEPDGFYRKFKARAREALKGVDFHRPSRTSKLIADSLFVATLALCVTAAATQSWVAIVASAIFLTWTGIIGHNFLHQRNSFRMYYLDLCFLSSKEWRIAHALSHHLFTNTVLDLEIIANEPFFMFLSQKGKRLIQRYLPLIYFPLIYSGYYFIAAIKRFYSVMWEFRSAEIRDAVPFLIPTLVRVVSPTAISAFLTFSKIMAISGFYFSLIGLSAAHHHPDIYHDGDVCRADTDWGLAELDAVRDRVEIESSIFLVLTNFGSHTLHHLLPTVDHAYLHLCEPAFVQTCKEFRVDTKLWTQWKLAKGQFQQMANVEPKKTANVR